MITILTYVNAPSEADLETFTDFARTAQQHPQANIVIVDVDDERFDGGAAAVIFTASAGYRWTDSEVAEALVAKFDEFSDD